MAQQLRELPHAALLPVGASRDVSLCPLIHSSGICGIACFFWISYFTLHHFRLVPFALFKKHVTFWDDLLLFIILLCLLFYPAGNRYQKRVIQGVALLCVFLSLAHLGVVLPSLFRVVVISLFFSSCFLFVFFCSTSPSLLLFRVCSGRRADGRLAVRVFPALRLAVPVQHDAEAVHQRGAEPEGTHLLVARAEEGAEHYAARAAAAGSLAVSAVFPVLLPAAWEIRGSSFCCLLKKTREGRLM